MGARQKINHQKTLKCWPILPINSIIEPSVSHRKIAGHFQAFQAHKKQDKLPGRPNPQCHRDSVGFSDVRKPPLLA